MECGICTELFDATDRVPKVLVPCGHTVCLQCLGLLPDSKCPTCRRDFNGPPPELPTNFAVLQLLEGVRLESFPRHAVDPAKKILRLLLAAVLTEDRAAAPYPPPAAGSPRTAISPPPAAEALPRREMNVKAISNSGPSAYQQEKAAALRNAPGVPRLVGLRCDMDPAWSLQLLQLAGPTVEQLSVSFVREAHLFVVHAMPRLRRLEMWLGDFKVSSIPMLPELPPSHAGLQWLRVRGLPRATTHSLLQVHARSLQSLQLCLTHSEPWEYCPDLAALLEQCSLRALIRLVLTREHLPNSSDGCRAQRAEVRKALPGREVVCCRCPCIDAVKEEAF